jgi:hypothetical protein
VVTIFYRVSGLPGGCGQARNGAPESVPLVSHRSCAALTTVDKWEDACCTMGHAPTQANFACHLDGGWSTTAVRPNFTDKSAHWASPLVQNFWDVLSGGLGFRAPVRYPDVVD